MNTTPGVSLFQGTDSIKVNTSLERAEEEEALEDQRRRNEELGNLLQNAFDDLDEDDTIDSTSNFQSDLIESNHDQHHKQEQQNLHHHQQHHPYDAEMHQLKMLLDSRSRELDNVKRVANDEFKKRDEMQKRLTIAEAELDRALASKKNTHELLVECKEKCSNQESTIGQMRAERRALEAENNTLLGKLETSQTLLADVQRKYDMVERDLNKNNERNAEVRRKQTEERHRAEIDMLQQQLEQLANKLDKKSSELEQMNTRYHALQHSHEVMLVEKSCRMSDLNHALDEALKQCEELRSRPDYFHENLRLQKHISSLQEQIASMEKTISGLNERLECTKAELDVMDGLLHQANLDDTPRRLSQTQGKVVGSTPLNTIDRVGHLKDELYRALANVRGKREELRRLQQNLDERSKEVRSLREEENKALVQLTTLREDNIRLANRIKILEEECEMRGKVTDVERANVEEVRELREEKSTIEEQCRNLEGKLIFQEQQTKRLDAQLKNVEVDLEELRQEHESAKLNYGHLHRENQELLIERSNAEKCHLELERHKFLLKDAQSECDRLKNLYVEIANAKEAQAYELNQLRKTDSVKNLQEERERCANLQRALQLAELKAAELSKILETEKLCHERDIETLRERLEKAATTAASSSKTAKDTTNNCTKCMGYFAEITKFEIQNLKLSNVNSINKQEIDDLTRDLQAANTLTAELSEKIKLSEQQEQLIAELKSKAQQFEEYIKCHSSASPKSDKSQNTSSDKGVGTSPELERAELRQIETRIRTDMAKVCAEELKRLQIRLRSSEEQYACLQREYQHVSAELQQRHTEVELLKQAILAEREQMQAILQQKDAVSEQLLQRCRDELRSKDKRHAELNSELAERQVQIETERQSMKAVMAQWEQQRKAVDQIEADWRQQLEERQQTHTSAIASWQTKYTSAKRTAANYKRYAEDKEAHMLKEYVRLRNEYDASLAKIEVRMKDALEQKSRELKEKFVAATRRKQEATDCGGCEKENIAIN